MTDMRRLIPAFAAVLMASGCSGPSGPGVASATYAPSRPGASVSAAADADTRLRQYAACLRENGLHVADPEPGQAGVRIDPHDPRDVAQRAILACVAYASAPEAPTPPNEADLSALRRYARCMRAHGLPLFPDPDPQTGFFPGLDKSNYDVNSATVRSALQACQALQPPAPPGG
jgi:hypothetical protein